SSHSEISSGGDSAYGNYQGGDSAYGNYQYAPANLVNASNAKTAINLLICPFQSSLLEPGQDYFVTNSLAPIAGDYCNAPKGTLQTTVKIPLTIKWSDTTPATAQVGSLSVEPPAELSMQMLSMSPMLTNGNIANGYSSQTYIFTGVPSVAQHAIWTWSALLADFANANVPNILSVNIEPEFVNVITPNNQNNQNTNARLSATSDYSSQTPTFQSSSLPTCGCNEPEVGCWNGYNPTQTCILPSPCPSSCPNKVSEWSWCLSGYLYSTYECVSTTTTITTTTATTTTTTSTTTTIKYTCTYTYQYTANLILQNIHNTYIPFDEVVKTKPNGQQKPQQQIYTVNAEVLPFFELNYQLPSPGYSNEFGINYSIFSPWNYATPSNNIDMFPIDTPSLTFFNYTNGTHSMFVSLPVSNMTNHSVINKALGNLSVEIVPPNGLLVLYNDNLSAIKVPSPYLNKPISVAAIPNDTMYVIYNTTVQSAHAISYTPTYTLEQINLIPKGYYDTEFSYAPPTPDSASTIGSEASWDGKWNAYWANVIELQNTTAFVSYLNPSKPNVYNIIDGSGGLILGGEGLGIDKNPCAFIPLNISANYAGDVFITGEAYTWSGIICGLGEGETPEGAIIVKLPNGNYVISKLFNKVLPEIAASPTGDEVFAATPSEGEIDVFNFTGSSIAPSPTGNISLSFSTTSPTGQQLLLNITQYFAQGGLYGYKFTDVAQSGFQPSTYFDRAKFHHPLAIADVNGYLYVLDEWTHGLGSNSYNSRPYTRYNILLIRAINSTGYNVPINPTTFDDVWEPQTCTAVNTITQQQVTGTIYTTAGENGQPQQPQDISCSPSGSCILEVTGSSTNNQQVENTQGEEYQWSCVANTLSGSTTYTQAPVSSNSSSAVIANVTFPPYGWPISANVTVGGKSVNFCSAGDCTYASSSGYTPIGPEVHAYFGSTTSGYGKPIVGFSVSYDGTINLLLKPTSEQTGYGFGPTIYYPDYNELIVGTRLNVQNYTRVFAGGPPSICYVDQQGSVCHYVPNIDNMLPPIYTVPDPFAYVENIGASRTLSLVSQLNNIESFSKGSGSSSSGGPQLYIASLNTPANQPDTILAVAANPQSEDDMQLYINGNMLAEGPGSATYDVCTQAFPCSSGETISVYATDNTLGQTTSTQTITVLPPTEYIATSALAPSTETYLNTQIYGDLLVPYAYTYQLKQAIANVQVEKAIGTNPQGQIVSQGPGSKAWTNCSDQLQQIESTLSPQQPSQTVTIYNYSLVYWSSNKLQALVENSDTYLEDVYTQALYVPDLRATIMPPDALYYIKNNRLFGYIRINETIPNAELKTPQGTYVYDYSENIQKILAYQQDYSYGITGYTETEPNGESIPTYEQISPQQANNKASYSDVSFTYSPQNEPNEITLFDFYQELNYLSNFDLNLGNKLGFRMLNIIFNDRFNNTIFAPIPIDIANTIVVSMQVNPQPQEKNPNQTIVYVNGTVYTPSQALGGAPVPLSNAKVYLYYGKNINFVNYNAITDPIDAMKCAYGFNSSTLNCTLANPNWVTLQQNAELFTYTPQFNSTGKCNPPPNSLLAENYVPCNLYGKYNLPAICPDTGQGNPEYCTPIYLNGTGVCTSQIGLFAIATTNSLGDFSANVVACGSGSTLGSTEIIAQYYGWPLQPLTANLLPVSLEATKVNLNSPYPAIISVEEPNYYYEPNETIQGLTIGEVMLSVGNISFAALIGVTLGIGIVLYISWLKVHKKG
ncbi:MAG: hypothetical protein ACP5T3_03170, partial [Candidatus Micrarchaeia archaeon]